MSTDIITRELTDDELRERMELVSSPPEREPHPWDLVDLSVDFGPPAEPTILRRKDGPGLFYPAVTNLLFAPFESAKTWLALLACKQVIDDGGSVLFVDFESSARSIRNRLKAMGLLTSVSNFGYIRPTLPLDQDRLDHALDTLQPKLVIIDACAEAMVTHELDEGNNSDVIAFNRLLPEPLEARGHGVILLDHVGYSGEAKSRPRGASAKMGAVHGSAIRIEVEQPFRRGHTDGFARLYVQKDREGGVRMNSTDEGLVGELSLWTDPVTGLLSVELNPPIGAAHVPAAPPAVVRQVRDFSAPSTRAMQQTWYGGEEPF